MSEKTVLGLPLTSIAQNEILWRSQLESYEPTLIYKQNINVDAGATSTSTIVTLESVKLRLPILDKGIKDVEFLQACFVSFLSRINWTDSVHIGLVAERRGISENRDHLNAATVPAVFHIDYNANALSVFEKCFNELKFLKDKHTFLSNMVYHSKDTRSHKGTPNHNFVLGTKLADSRTFAQDILNDCNMLLLFDLNFQEVEFQYYEHPDLDYNHIIGVLRNFSTFLHSVNECKLETNLRSILMVSEDELNRFYQPPPSDLMGLNDGNLSEVIQIQCKLKPLSVALKSTKGMMTFGKLFEEITSFACILKRNLSLQSERALIALYLPNSITYVVSLLSLLTIDIAFLPLPIDYPPERLLFVLNDAMVCKMIMEKETFETCQAKGFQINMRFMMNYRINDRSLVVVELEHNKTDTIGRNREGNFIKTQQELNTDFAYLMYTSSTTGRPKGVKVKASSLINLAQSQIICWDIRPGDVIAQFASVGYDASISEIFTSLLSGASLAVLDSSERLGKEFITAMNEMKVSMITLVPSALRIYAPTEFPYLRKVVTAGESCTLDIAFKWTSTGKIRFFNAYGPTECTVCASSYEYRSVIGNEHVSGELPIGKAIDGVNIYLFDALMNPVPQNVIGEIYIGGIGLSHGYIGQSSYLNKDVFVKYPLSDSNATLYKSGDLAFRDTDGNIFFVGRTDDQIKIRGHRMHLNEINQVLIQHPNIDMAEVVVHECEKTNEKSLAAFIAPASVHVSELREYMAQRLPKFMVPTYIKKMEVAEFPKTLNGKIDRKRLAQDIGLYGQAETGGYNNLTGMQLTVAGFWCQVFKLDESYINRLHRHSSFSEFGGNSLQLVLFLRLIKDHLEVDVSFTSIRRADTIEEYAEIIQKQQNEMDTSRDCNAKSKDNLREMIFDDSELHTNIQSLPKVKYKYSSREHTKSVLISGVTGFIGAFLLSELLEQTDDYVYCMVRESTEVRGMGRVIDNMRRYDLWKLEYSSRITVVLSDLSQKNMGINPEIYKSMCNDVDVIFMNAAMMNFNTTYEDHRVVNVHGTKEFMKFAFTGVQKYLFITSSLSVFLFPPGSVENANSRHICSELDFVVDPIYIEGGYGQSKWASERLVMQALDLLPGGAIFRPARVSGRSTDGKGPTDDVFARTMIGMKKLGAYPDMYFPYDLIPVDFCAKALIEIALKIISSEPVLSGHCLCMNGENY